MAVPISAGNSGQRIDVVSLETKKDVDIYRRWEMEGDIDSSEFKVLIPSSSTVLDM